MRVATRTRTRTRTRLKSKPLYYLDIYEGLLKSPCTCRLSLKRVNKTIHKYIFSKRTVHSRLNGIFLMMYELTLQVQTDQNIIL